MPENERTLTRGETERYIISERLPEQYRAADGGMAARFRFVQDGVAAAMSAASEPEKRAGLSGVLNSLRAFSGEFAKYAENRAMYESARQIYEEYLASPESKSGSMLIPARINGESVRINAADLADIACVSERRIQDIVRDRHRAAEQEFGSGRVVGGVDFYGLTTPECAEALLGYAGNATSGKPPENAAQAAFAALNQRLAEKRAITRESPQAGIERTEQTKRPEQTERKQRTEPTRPTQRTEQESDLREQLDRAMERIAALEEQNRRLSERSRALQGLQATESSGRGVQQSAGKQGTVRERISFRQLLAEAGMQGTLTSPDSFTPEMSVQKQNRSL